MAAIKKLTEKFNKNIPILKNDKSCERNGNNKSKESGKQTALRGNKQVFDSVMKVDKGSKKRSAIRESNKTNQSINGTTKDDNSRSPSTGIRRKLNRKHNTKSK